MRDLVETVDAMLSPDYKERFKAEYWQVSIRMMRLFNLLQTWDTLEFKPKCDKTTLNMQYQYMKLYRKILLHRALIEGIDLEEEE